MEKKIITRKQDNDTIISIRAAVDRMVSGNPFSEITIRDICSEVGITVGTFYNYFSSKNDLLLDRYIRYMESYENYYEECLNQVDEIEALKLIIKSYVDYAGSRIYNIYKEYIQIMVSEYDRWVEVKSNSLADIIIKIVVKGQKNGTITKQIEPKDICSLIMIAMNGITMQYMTRDKDILSNDNLINMIIDSLDALKAENI